MILSLCVWAFSCTTETMTFQHESACCRAKHGMGPESLQASQTLHHHTSTRDVPGRMPASLKTASLLASPEAPPAAQKSNWCTCKRNHPRPGQHTSSDGHRPSYASVFSC